MSEDDGDFTPINTEAEPTTASGAGEFNIKVSVNGVPIGWWADGGGPEYWITAVENQADSTTWTQVSYNGGNYLQKSKNNYLSYRINKPYEYGLKMRDWAAAANWKVAGKNLLAVENGNLVGRDGDSFYCNGENVIEVEFVAK